MEDIKTVHYSTKDPIQNLKIKVTLVRLSSQKAKAKVNPPQGQPGQQEYPAAPYLPPQQQVVLGPDGQPIVVQQPIAPAAQAGQPLPPPPAADYGPQAGPSLSLPMPPMQAVQQQGPSMQPMQQVPAMQQDLTLMQQAVAVPTTQPAPAIAPPPAAVQGGVAPQQQDPFMQGKPRPGIAMAAAADPFAAAAASAARPQRGGPVSEGAAPFDPAYAPLRTGLMRRGSGGTGPGPIGEAFEPQQRPGYAGTAPAQQQEALAYQQQTFYAQPQFAPQQQQQLPGPYGPPQGAYMPPGGQQQPQQQGAYMPAPQQGAPGMQQPMLPPQQGPYGFDPQQQQQVPYGYDPQQQQAQQVPYGYDPQLLQQQQPLQMPPQQPPQQAGGEGAAAGGRFEVSHVFSWQEKVYSRSEVVEAQAAAAAAGELGGDDVAAYGGYGPDQGAGAGAGAGAGGRRGKRTMALGSGTHTQARSNVDPRARGSVLFSYVHAEPFCERGELSKAVTTGGYEQENWLYAKLMGSAKSRQQVLNFRLMYLMADLGDEHDAPHSCEHVLVALKAHPDGSFDMRPGFNKPGKKYRFEDEHGGIYEYSVEDASPKAEPSLARRTAKLQRQVAERAKELRAMGLNARFTPPPADRTSCRLALMGEILAAADFARDRLYVEYALAFDPTSWEMATTSWGAAEPGMYKGVTASSRPALYPADPSSSTPERWVAHFAHPVEAELISRGPPGRWPVLYFQVCSYDLYNRFTSEGYGWLALGPHSRGSATHYVDTWKPMASLRDKQQEFFIGGSRELQDLAYLTLGTSSGTSGAAGAGAGGGSFIKRTSSTGGGNGRNSSSGNKPPARDKSVTAGAQGQGAGVPEAAGPDGGAQQQQQQQPGALVGQSQSQLGLPPGAQQQQQLLLSAAAAGPRVMSKYGFRTESSGTLKVRLHVITQQYDPDVAADNAAAAKGGAGGAAGGGLPGSPLRSPGGGKRNRKEVSLAVVVERARSRLRNARGGELQVRPGLVSEAPAIRQQPQAVVVAAEGQAARLGVTATGLEPLRYQWFKDDKRLSVATADSPTLILAEVAPVDAGEYYCQVSNKDGSVNSSKSLLRVDKVSRLARAMGGAPASPHTTTADETRSQSSRGGGGGTGTSRESTAAAALRAGPARVSRLQAAAQRQQLQNRPSTAGAAAVPVAAPAAGPDARRPSASGATAGAAAAPVSAGAPPAAQAAAGAAPAPAPQQQQQQAGTQQAAGAVGAGISQGGAASGAGGGGAVGADGFRRRASRTGQDAAGPAAPAGATGAPGSSAAASGPPPGGPAAGPAAAAGAAAAPAPAAAGGPRRWQPGSRASDDGDQRAPAPAANAAGGAGGAGGAAGGSGAGALPKPQGRLPAFKRAADEEIVEDLD